MKRVYDFWFIWQNCFTRLFEIKTIMFTNVNKPTNHALRQCSFNVTLPKPWGILKKTIQTWVTPAKSANNDRWAGRQCFLPPSAQQRLGKQSTEEVHRFGNKSYCGGGVHWRYCSSILTAVTDDYYFKAWIESSIVTPFIGIA